MEYFDSLKFATWTALECKKMDFSPELAELKNAFEKVFKEIEFFLSTLQYIYKRDLSLFVSWTKAKISDNENQISIVPTLWKTKTVVPKCIFAVLEMYLDFANKYDKAESKKINRMQLELESLQDQIHGDGSVNMDAANSKTLSTSGSDPIIQFEKYKKEMDDNNRFIFSLFKTLQNKTHWELWSWKMPEVEKFKYDVFRLNRTVKKQTLKRAGILTRKVVG